MSVKFFLQQLRRSPKRTLLNILLLTAVTAFFCMSVNLYQNSIRNLEMAEENYVTIALMELVGDVDSNGALAEADSENYVGRQAVGVRGYDISRIVTAPGVARHDLRSRWGGRIQGDPMMDSMDSLAFPYCFIRFTIDSEEPIHIRLQTNYISEPGRNLSHTLTEHNINILEAYPNRFRLDLTKRTTFPSAWLWEDDKAYYAEHIRYLNGIGGEDTVDQLILYPGVEYFASMYIGNLSKDADTNILLPRKSRSSIRRNFLSFSADAYGMEYSMYYENGTEGISRFSWNGQPFYLQLWEDVQNDPELMAYYQKAMAAYEIALDSYNVTLTNDISGIAAFHLGGCYLKEGRMITGEEYAAGAKVCMISETMAIRQGWRLGDKLDLDLYPYDKFVNRSDTWSGLTPFFNYQMEGTTLYPQGEYEIVGIYAQRQLSGHSDLAPTTLSMPWCAIYIPEGSVSGLPEGEPLVHGALLTLWLENGSIDRFLAAMDALGITQEREGAYTAKFSFYDQGYSTIQPSLQAMLGASRLLLILSAILLAVTSVLLAWFFAQNQKHNVGIFRMLGGKKPSALLAVTACALVIALAGGVLGMGLGDYLTDTVGASIVERSLQQSAESADFQSYVLGGEAPLAETLATGADNGLTLLSAAVGMGLFLALLMLFVLLYIHKEPRALLPKGES